MPRGVVRSSSSLFQQFIPYIRKFIITYYILDNDGAFNKTMIFQFKLIHLLRYFHTLIKLKVKMMNDTHNSISKIAHEFETIRKYLKQVYHIEDIAKMYQIGSYCDYNIFIEQATISTPTSEMKEENQNGQLELKHYVFKISSPKEQWSQIQLEMQTINYIENAYKQNFTVPQFLTSKNGRVVEEIDLHIQSGEQLQGYKDKLAIRHKCRLIKFIHGTNLIQLLDDQLHCIYDKRYSDGVSDLQNGNFRVLFGKGLGELSLNLASYSEQLMTQNLLNSLCSLPNCGKIWNLSNFGHIQNHLKVVKDNLPKDNFLIFQKIVQVYKSVNPFKKIQDSLKGSKCLIHSDASASNIILLADKKKIGIIDFSDMLYSHRVCEVAIALAKYPSVKNQQLSKQAQNRNYLLKSYSEILYGYLKYIQLSQVQKEVLLLLVYARITTSCIMAQYSIKTNGRNTHIEKAYNRSNKTLNLLIGDQKQNVVDNLELIIKNQSHLLWKLVEDAYKKEK